ncbi:hypothetical protein QNO07_21070 [Streptomyces sp. 549]|uniref:hypothetical protein n=1 Tax=Streptomyces sp. 549 TaxID=3049076 RepID=UPI0024C23F71|nr:hypothetical protein [Streptomyces sp. 549]MDK1475875.1 hypothetical protein [Streptomyces sp. 549]
MKATPACRIVEVYGADAYLDDNEAFTAAQVEVVAGNGYHRYLGGLKLDIKVRMSIRVRDRTPPLAAVAVLPVRLPAGPDAGRRSDRAHTGRPPGAAARGWSPPTCG